MQSAIIFGGNTGIGEIISRNLLNKNYKITVASINATELNEYKNSLDKNQIGNVNLVLCDICQEESVENVYQSHLSNFKITANAIINSAAIQGPIGPLWELSVKDIKCTIDIDLTGSMIVTKYAILHLLHNGGSIILFSGGGSVEARPNFCAYGAAKTGVLRLVETVAEELKLKKIQNVIINAVAPGAVKTRMTKEVLDAKDTAGDNAVKEAENINATGGTNPELLNNLIDFLIDINTNKGFTGRLVHVKEDYIPYVEKYGNEQPNNDGKLRRISLPIFNK